MGLFSKKKTYVESFTMNLVEDTSGYVNQSVLTSIHYERPIADDLIANTVRGLGAKMKRYYKYGRDKYTYELPEGSLGRKHASPTAVGLCIADNTGEDQVLVDYSVFGEAEAYYFVEHFLVQTRGYDPETGIVENPPEATSITTYFRSAEFDSANTVKIEYARDSYYGSEKTMEEVVVLGAPVNIGSEYYHCRYLKYDEFSGEVIPDEYFYWFYDTALKQYPTLEPANSSGSNFYPVVPLRMHKQDLTQNDGSDRYKTSKRLLAQMGLNITQLGDGIHQSPDIDDVDHAYVIMGIKTTTENQYGKRYLYDFFNQYRTYSYVTKSDVERWDAQDEDAKNANVPPINKLTITEADTYNVEIGWLYIESEIKDGVLGKGKVGYCETDFVIRPAKSYDRYKVEQSSLILRKQISRTQYQELEVYGLVHTNKIYQKHHIDTSLAEAVEDVEDQEDKDGLVIPISIQVLDTWKLHEMNELGYDAPKIIFNAKVTKKLKWYQTGFFQFVMIVVAVAITIATGVDMISWGAGLLGSSSAIIGAIVIAGISIAVQYGVAYLVDVLGIESAMILAIIAVAMYFVPGGQAISAEILSAVQSGIIKGVSQGMQMLVEGIAQEISALQAEITDYQKDLEEWDTHTDVLVNLWGTPDTTTGLALPSESPEMYYDTRIHLGNMARFDLVHIENFADNNLQLEGVSVHHGIKV